MKEALNHPGWYDAMLEEIHALEESHTWDLVDLPSTKRPVGYKWVLTIKVNPVGCKWVFIVKVNSYGFVAKLKARLVAKEYSQTYGVDYSDTFSPVVKLTSIGLFISLVASKNWPLH